MDVMGWAWNDMRLVTVRTMRFHFPVASIAE